jgi:DNA repair protein RecO (recombination protein O)
MIVTTSGIVLSSIRYSDSSVIARIYTNDIGLRAFMVRTSKGRAALPKLGLLQPLTLVELSFINDNRPGLKSVKFIDREIALNAIPFDTVKTCLALFMAEVIVRSIGEEERNHELFLFLKNAVLLLDQTTDNTSNFHLKFMLEFSSFLGFYPQQGAQSHGFFDLVEGQFCPSEPIHPYMLSGTLVPALSSLLAIRIDEHASVKIANADRRILLQKLLDYYRLHLHGMKEITSHKVLEEVLS